MRDGKGRRIDSTTPRWLDTLCCAPVPKLTGYMTRCGLRQYQTTAGPTCGDGHGGAEGMEMAHSEALAWERDNANLTPPWEVEPMPHQIIDNEIKQRSKHAAFGAAMKEMHAINTTELEPVGDILAEPLYKVGHVVIMKSGGPRMTVLVDGVDSVECVWFSKRGKLQRSTFLVVTLREPINDPRLGPR